MAPLSAFGLFGVRAPLPAAVTFRGTAYPVIIWGDPAERAIDQPAVRCCGAAWRGADALALLIDGALATRVDGSLTDVLLELVDALDAGIDTDGAGADRLTAAPPPPPPPPVRAPEPPRWANAGDAVNASPATTAPSPSVKRFIRIPPTAIVQQICHDGAQKNQGFLALRRHFRPVFQRVRP